MRPDWIAKPSIDIGLFTNQLDPMLNFWRERIGLRFDHMLPTGGGVRQHRHLLDDAVFKLNHARNKLPEREPGGVIRLIIASTMVSTPVALADPDGNQVQLVPEGMWGLHHWAVEVAVEDEESFFEFYHHQLGLPRDETLPLTVQCGKSKIVGRYCRSQEAAPTRDEMRRLGYRYLTIQVWDVDAAHSRVLAAGGREGVPPRTLGETARISFVRDRLGNWIELSQRASVTGQPLPSSAGSTSPGNA